MIKFYFVIFLLLAYLNPFSQTREEYFFNRGCEKARLQDYRGAISDFSKSIEINPNNESAYNNRGAIKAKLHDYTGAIVDYDKSIQIQPTFGHAYYNRGIIKITLRQTDSGRRDLNKAAEYGYVDVNEANKLAIN